MDKLPLLSDLDVKGKKVLVRADLDVSTTRLQATDYRLQSLIPTLRHLRNNKSKIVIIGHRGRPEPIQINSPDTDGLPEVQAYGLSGVAKKLEKTLGSTVGFIPDVNVSIVSDINQGDVLVLENLRFDKREEENSEEFAKELASLADVYVNEAFAVSHRNHASVVALPREVKRQSKRPSVAIGLRFEEESRNLSKVLENPKKPVVFVINGVKKDKLGYVEKFKKVADKILVGGRLPEYMEEGRVSVRVRGREEKIVVANLTQDKEDITIHSIERFEKEIEKAGTIVLSGPLGKFEEEGHSQGTKRVFTAVAESSAFKVAGGGDTEKALKSLRLTDKLNWISVGGGAMLEFLARGTLPGIDALRFEKELEKE